VFLPHPVKNSSYRAFPFGPLFLCTFSMHLEAKLHFAFKIQEASYLTVPNRTGDWTRMWARFVGAILWLREGWEHRNAATATGQDSCSGRSARRRRAERNRGACAQASLGQQRRGCRRQAH
jgi:hypothetical protein